MVINKLFLYFSLIILFSFYFNPLVFAQASVSLGISTDLYSRPMDAENKINQSPIPFSPLGINLYYSTLEFPFLLYQNPTLDLKLRFGIQSSTMVLIDQESERVDTNQRIETSVEVTTLNLYATYINDYFLADQLAFYWFAGPGITESSLTEGKTAIKETTLNDGSIEEDKGKVSKQYEVRYNIGAMAGVGFNYVFEDRDEMGVQLVHIYQNTRFNYYNNTIKDLSLTQIQIYYVIHFD